MIVREIKENPVLLLSFDWFNDYADTRSWAVVNCPNLVGVLDQGHQAWLDEQRREAAIDAGADRYLRRVWQDRDPGSEPPR